MRLPLCVLSRLDSLLIHIQLSRPHQAGAIPAPIRRAIWNTHGWVIARLPYVQHG